MEMINELNVAEDISLYCATVMPDHLHLLFKLGDYLNLQRTVSKLKSNLTRKLNLKGLLWQRNFFDHRLRSEDSSEGFAFYIFMNPYRKGLVELDQQWHGWMCAKDFHPEFLENLKDPIFPQMKWLKAVELKGLIAKDLQPS